MKFVIICFAVCMSATLVSSQFFGSYRNDFGLGLNPLNGDFGGPAAFGSLSENRPSVRDPRQNRGPVVFPPPPSDGPVESSGVIIGGSGFGFVPPSGQAQQSRLLSSHRFNNRFFNQFSLF